MPKSKHNRKGKNRGGDKRPIPRSGRNDGPADYRSAKPPTTGGLQPAPEASRQCPYLDRIAGLTEVFTKDECKKIIDNALNNWTERESEIQRDKDGKIEQNFEQDLDYRNTTLFIPPGPDDWLFGRVLGTINAFNEKKDGYGFHIVGLAEPPNMMRYQAPNIDKHGKPGKYDWHVDLGPGAIPSMRKLSYSILLNPGEYEGGEFVSKIGRQDVVFENTGDSPDSHDMMHHLDNDLTGTMILFPSYMLHRISEVTKGTRYSLVGWAHGNSFI